MPIISVCSRVIRALLRLNSRASASARPEILKSATDSKPPAGPMPPKSPRGAGRTSSGRLGGRFLQKGQHRLEELKALFLKQNKMGCILDQHAALDRRVGQITHQPLAILRKGPGVEFTGDHQDRNVNG